jgi:hypothetical protein
MTSFREGIKEIVGTGVLFDVEIITNEDIKVIFYNINPSWEIITEIGEYLNAIAISDYVDNGKFCIKYHYYNPIDRCISGGF